MFSFWEQNSFIKSPDIIIIGSGLVGLYTALSLKKKSPTLHILILERGMLPSGASTKNAGFACFGSASELQADMENSSPDEVYSLVEKRWKGLAQLRKILGDKAISYESSGGHEIFMEDEKSLFNQCLDFLPELNKNLFHITGEKEMYSADDSRIKKFGFQSVSHLIFNKGEGQLDTGLMMKALLSKVAEAGIEILNGAQVKSIKENDHTVSVILAGNNPSELPEKIIAKKLLICVNGFAKKFLPEADLMPARAQVLITSPVENLPVKGSFHFDQGYYYFRNVGNRILFGGGRNLDLETEKTDLFGVTKKIQDTLESILHSVILPDKEFSIEMRWSGIMGLGKHKSPIIKKTGQNVFCAIRLGGMGVAIGPLVGEEASEMVLQTL